MSTPRLDVQTCLWFDGRIDEAADFYVSLIPDSRILARTAYAAGGDYGIFNEPRTYGIDATVRF